MCVCVCVRVNVHRTYVEKGFWFLNLLLLRITFLTMTDIRLVVQHDSRACTHGSTYTCITTAHAQIFKNAGVCN